MRNFYEVEGKYFLDLSKYMNEWENYIDLYSKDGFEKKGDAQRIGSHVQTLWNYFNGKRDKIDKHYLDAAVGLQSYVAAFLLPNIERVFSTLVKDENISAIESFFNHEKDELIIADFGCGPLSGSVGLLAVLEYVFFKKNYLIPPKKILIYAIDRSEKVVEFGSKLIKNSGFQNTQITIERLTSPEKIVKLAHIVLCINIFNEVPERHRLKTLKTLYSKTESEGLVFILEPGQEIHAKNLGNLRDDFFNSVVDCEIISPCAHKKNCPLSGRTLRKDWCWFRHAWNPPKTLLLIDKFSKVDHHELNFSYLFFQKNKESSTEKYFARCVSDEFMIDIKNNKAQLDYFENNLVSGEKNEFTEMLNFEGDIHKILLCTFSGDLESAFVKADPSQKEYRRGRRIKTNSELYIRAKERS